MPPTRSNDWLLKASSPRSSIGTPHDPGALRTMSLTPLLDVLVTDPMVRRILTAPMGTDHAAPESLDIAVSAGARPLLIAALAGAQDSSVRRPILAVSATGREAEDLVAALRCFLLSDVVAYFPCWETLPHERFSPRSDTVCRRLAVLRRLTHPDATDPAYGPVDVVVAPVRALLQPLVKGLGNLAPVALRAGDEMPPDQVGARVGRRDQGLDDPLERHL